jgi:hypothetical protein
VGALPEEVGGAVVLEEVVGGALLVVAFMRHSEGLC